MSKQQYVLIDGVWVPTGGPAGPPGSGSGGAETVKTTAKVSTYYSFPSIVNGSGGKLDAAASAAAVFAAYDHVIFGSTPTDPIFDPGHTDYANTKKICGLLVNTYDTKVWGYLDTEAVAGNSLPEFVVKVDKWKATGAVGIFLDKFGFDYGSNNRTRQNELVDAVHAAGLPVIVNVWNIPDAFNPAFGPVHITVGDVLYLESFTANTEAYLGAGANGYATLSDMKARMDTAAGYRVTHGFDVWCSNIVERDGLSASDRVNFIRQCEALARIFRADGVSVDSGYYSSAFGDAGKVDPFVFYYELGEAVLPSAGWEMSADWHAVMANDLGLEAHHYTGEGYYVITRPPQEEVAPSASGGGGGYIGQWSSLVAYPAGSVVTYSGKTWGCIAAVAAGQPAPAAAVVVNNIPTPADNAANALDITIAANGYSGLVSWNNTGYSTEAGEPGGTAQNYVSGWLKYKPAGSGPVTFTTANSAGDTYLSLYQYNGGATFSFTDLVLVAGNDDSAGGVDALITYSVVAGKTYYLQSASLTINSIQQFNIANALATPLPVLAWQQLALVEPIPTGGTTDQVLAKSSGADYAVKWATPSGGGTNPPMIVLGPADPVPGGTAVGTVIVRTG